MMVRLVVEEVAREVVDQEVEFIAPKKIRRGS